MTNSLREKYFAGEILKIGDIVEDANSGKSLKILSRGSNYITVESDEGTSKKWLDEVITEETKLISEPDFSLMESGQLKMFGYETKMFDSDLSEFIIEQFSEFADLYSKHQIVKLLDTAMMESNLDRQYELLEKVSTFYTKNQIDEPLIVEGIKSELERKRLSQIIANVAGIEPDTTSPYKTVLAAFNVLKKKYTDKKQWEVLWPFFKLINTSGIHGILPLLPFKFDQGNADTNPPKYDPKLEESITSLFEENFDELLESICEEDLIESFNDEDCTEEFLTEEQLDEVLSFSGRLSLGRKMKSREANLEVKRARALTRGASTSVLLSRARRMAETMLKRRIFRKDPNTLSRQEKERFEAGAIRRRALVAKLAQRLVSRVRIMQNARIHSAKGGQPSNAGHQGHSADIGAS